MKKDLFHSAHPFAYPVIEVYENQKHLHIIKTRPRKLKSQTTFLLPRNFDNLPLWDFYSSRLELAMSGKGKNTLTHFPGSTVPGPGVNTRRKIGSLAFEKFLSVISLSGGFPNIGPFKTKVQLPFSRIVSVPSTDWKWEKILRPSLKVLHPAQDLQQAPREKIDEFLFWLGMEINKMISMKKIPTKKLLSLVRSCWSSDAEFKWESKTMWLAKELIEQAKDSREPCDWVSFLFELENFVHRIQHSQKLSVHSYGQFNGCWIEVGTLPLSDIHSTELCVTERALTELVNVREKGFAPIVVNEWGSDTDGTHRLTASWLWNLLQFVAKTELSIENERLQFLVYKFVTVHKKAMGSVIIHEVLRVLQEILESKEMLIFLQKNVLPYLNLYESIEKLPVLLLPEYSCGAVLKELYDNGVASIRVNPIIYEMLAKNRDYVLPPRGPYHLTDRAILPWFRILKSRS